MDGTSAPPTVAIVVPVHDKREFVAETLASALAQTHREIVVVVVDDGSTDGSLDVVRAAVADDDRASVLATPNGGVSRARTTGWETVAGQADAVLFLDADDLLRPDAVAVLVDHLVGHPQAVAVYSDVCFVDDVDVPLADPPDQTRWARTRLGRRTVPSDDPVTTLDAVWSRFWALPSCTLVRATTMVAIDGWDSDLCRPQRPFHAEDKDLAIQLALHGELHHVAAPLVRYRVLPSGHKDAMYAGLKALDAKWWNAPLDRSVRRRVRSAIWFDARVHLLDSVAAARHDGLAGVPAAARSVLRFATTGLRMRRRSPA